MPSNEHDAALTGNNREEPPAFSPEWAFFLDVDGTLLDIADHPHSIRVDPGLRHLLRELLALTDGALALVSGRAIADIDRLLASANFCVAGQHGAERRDAAGRLHLHRLSLGKLRRAGLRLRRLVAEHPQLVLEDKGMSLALHYRLAPQLGEEVRDVMRAMVDKLGDRFELQTGKMVFEIKVGGTDKGAAIEEYMREKPFRKRLPVFVGDDLTDEAGFEFVNRVGGHSIKVGEGVSSARWRLADANAVRAWLGTFIDRHRSADQAS